jgi:hypothetical protein
MDYIDNVYDLMNLSREELDEILLEPKYNKALLRELVRRTLKVANEYKFSLDLKGKSLTKIDDKAIELQKDIAKALEKFNS